MAVVSAAAVWCAGPLAVTAAADVGGGPAVARAGMTGGGWGQAIEVPGLAALNKSGDAIVLSVSCPSAGNCAAGGDYEGVTFGQGFVVTEQNGRWGTAITVPGLGQLNASGAGVTSVSCGTEGNCAAGGVYRVGLTSHFQAFVVSERNGRWGKAIEVPGSAALNKHRNAQVNSVSCASAGNCAAGGYYRDGFNHFQAFVVSERNSRWGKAEEVPGSAVLNVAGDATVQSVSCGSAGNCAAAGSYWDGSAHFQAFVVSERNGRWGKAREMPGSVVLNAGDATVVSVSCASAGNCAAGGYYTDGFSHEQAFIASQRNGTWGKAREVPGSGPLNAGGSARVESASCTSAGTCAAVGVYRDGSGNLQPFVVSERNGQWGTAATVSGLRTLDAGGFAEVLSASCAPPAYCAAGGFYVGSSGHGHAFVVVGRNGHWGKVIKIPGLGALNAVGSGLDSVSCASAGACTGGGSYTDGTGAAQGFVVSQT